MLKVFDSIGNFVQNRLDLVRMLDHWRELLEARDIFVELPNLTLDILLLRPALLRYL